MTNLPLSPGPKSEPSTLLALNPDPNANPHQTGSAAALAFLATVVKDHSGISQAAPYVYYLYLIPYISRVGVVIYLPRTHPNTPLAHSPAVPEFLPRILWPPSPQSIALYG